MAFSAGESGRALSAYPSIAGSLPSGDTSVPRASTRCHAGLSTRALLPEWTSRCGPPPQRSAPETSSASVTPFAPSVVIRSPSCSSATAGGGQVRDLVEPGIAQQLHGEVAPLRDSIILCRDRRLVNPSLQPSHRLRVTPVDLCLNVVQAAGSEGRQAGPGKRCRPRCGALEE